MQSFYFSLIAESDSLRVESDIMLDVKVQAFLKRQQGLAKGDGHLRSKRNVINFRIFEWTNGIMPYTFAEDFRKLAISLF